MTTRRRENGGREPLGRTLYDISQVLESAEDVEPRVRRALELLRQVAPYEVCALLEAHPGHEPRLVVVPAVPPEQAASLMDTLSRLLAQLVEDPTPPPGPPPGPPGTYLAVPLVGLDRVIGILFVEAPGGGYAVRHLRALSMVGAKVAAYLTLLRAGVEAPPGPAPHEEVHAAAAASRATDAFLVLVSERLKAPLAATLEEARALGAPGASESGRAHAVERIEANIHEQSRLIDDLVDLSRISVGDLRLDRAPIEPSRWIRAAIEELRPRARERSIRLEAVLDGARKELVVDPRRLGQIVSSLLANAIDATPAGGRVEVRLECAGAWARIQVIDDGVGIRAELLPRIFERASRASGAGAHPGGGLGIGLAIVKGLVELHGGHVRAESAGEGKGATFTVELPLGGAEESRRR